MFSNYGMAQAMVADRQRELRQAATNHRLTRLARRGRRAQARASRVGGRRPDTGWRADDRDGRSRRSGSTPRRPEPVVAA